MPQTTYHSYPCRSCAPLAGYVLLAAGAVLLFTCVPCWAWLALVGVGLMAAGWLMIRMCSTWR